MAVVHSYRSMQSMKTCKLVFYWLLLCRVSVAARDNKHTAPFRRIWPWDTADGPNQTYINRVIVHQTKAYLQLIEEETDFLCSTWNSHIRPIQLVMYGDEDKLPDECDRVKICSTHACVVFGREAWLLSVILDSAAYAAELDESNIILSGFATLLRMNYSHVTNNARFNPQYDSEYRIRAFTSKSLRTALHNSNTEVFMRGISFVNSTIKTDCYKLLDGVRDIEIYTSSPMGIGCSAFALCNLTKCHIYTTTSIQFATIIVRNTSHVVNRLIPFCASSPAGFLRKRSLSRFPHSEYKDGGLRFNLPYYRYCGPGTDVAEADDAGGPVDEVDAACRDHDLAYMLQDDPEVADLQLLNAVHKTGSWLYPLFAVSMESKRYFEKITGYRYTSYLYYVQPDVSTTTVHYFYYNSAYDSFNISDPVAAIGRDYENRWRSMVDDVWRGYCYTKAYSSDEEGKPRAGPSHAETTPAHTDKSTSGEPRESNTSQECPETPAATEDAQYPIPPAHLIPCRVLINELATANTESTNQYIELTRVCPKESPTYRPSRSRSLKGYRIYVIENGDPPKLHLSANLNDFKLKEVQETWKAQRTFKNYYFLVGTLQDRDMQLRITSRNSIQSKIPAGHEGSFAVVLVYDTGDVTLPRPAISVRTVNAPDLTPEQMRYLEETIQDVLVYGTKCEDGCEYLQSLWTKTGKYDPLLHELITDIPLDDEGLKMYASMSRCTTSLLPMLSDAWEQSIPTPGGRNVCPMAVNPPFVFTLNHGRKLQSSARKIALNVLHFFEVARENPDTMLGTPLELTARSTALSRKTITKIKGQLLGEGEISTPSGRKRQRCSRVTASFDNFDIESIKRIIQGYYAANRPPLIHEVYRDVIECYAGEARKKFSIKLFRKLLKQLGFHYGKINLRDVILQRPDIVNKRWTFLEAMRDNENEEGEDTLPVVYTDETWIDPHARTGKAIVPMQGRISYSEKLKYTYQKHKVSRGSRVIILHAAGPQGMINEAMTVYPVGGSKVSSDYHDNVDHVTYSTFMTKLFTTLQHTGPHIIVIDNAPYHSKSHAPKQSTRKAEMEAWLNEYDNDGALSGRIHGRKYLKPEVWSQVLKVKDKIEHHLIDLEAKKYGHKIVRLPPYQCEFNPIEYVWFDVKNYVRNKNTEQTTEGAKMYAEQYFLMYTAEKFQKHAQHTRRLRQESWNNEQLYDRFLDHHESLIVPLDEHSTDDSEEEDTPTTDNVTPNDNVYSMIHNDGVVEVEVDLEDDETPTVRRRLDVQS